MDSDKLTASISFSFDKNSDMNHASTGDYAIIFGVADGKSILGEYRDTRHCFVAAVGEQAEIEYDKLTRKAIDIEKDKQAQAEEKSKNEKETYINSCETIDYETLARNPEKYKGQHFKLKGKVVQVLDSDSWFENATTLRVNITNKGDDNFELWDDTIVCSVNIPKGGDRILEDDIIEFYGDCDGLYTYKSIFGQKISVPKIDIKYYGIAK